MDWEMFWHAFALSLPSLLAAIAAYLKARHAEVKAEQTHSLLDSRMDQLVELKIQAVFAEHTTQDKEPPNPAG